LGVGLLKLFTIINHTQQTTLTRVLRWEVGYCWQQFWPKLRNWSVN